jgi:hypothetical protein
METRNIIDYQGNKIGEMQMPDGTSEEVWANRLAMYSKAPPSDEEKAMTYLSASVAERKVFCENLMDRLKIINVSQGINIGQALWFHHRARALSVSYNGENYTIDLLNLVISGDVETACIVLMNAIPDDMTESYHWLSQERINWIVGEIKTYLGWA